jgi:hypothetical protein
MKFGLIEICVECERSTPLEVATICYNSLSELIPRAEKIANESEHNHGNHLIDDDDGCEDCSKKIAEKVNNLYA